MKRTMKQPKKKAAVIDKPSIPECKAFEICKRLGVGCTTCLALSAFEWVKHVKAVMAKNINADVS